MNIKDLKTIDDLKRFLDGSTCVAYAVVGDKKERYEQISKLLKRYDYHRLKRGDRGVLLAFVVKVTGMSRQQMTRLVKRYREKGEIVHRPKTVNGFKKKYTEKDIECLAALDACHGTLNGKATRKLLERACQIYGQTEYQRLAELSVSHLYNLRKSKRYLGRRHCRYLFCP